MLHFTHLLKYPFSTTKREIGFILIFGYAINGFLFLLNGMDPILGGLSFWFDTLEMQFHLFMEIGLSYLAFALCARLAKTSTEIKWVYWIVCGSTFIGCIMALDESVTRLLINLLYSDVLIKAIGAVQLTVASLLLVGLLCLVAKASKKIDHGLLAACAALFSIFSIGQCAVALEPLIAIYTAPLYQAKDYDPELTKKAKDALPIIAALSAYRQAKGRFPQTDKADELRSYLPLATLVRHGQDIPGTPLPSFMIGRWSYYNRKNIYILSTILPTRLGNDAELDYYYDGSKNTWSYDSHINTGPIEILLSP